MRTLDGRTLRVLGLLAELELMVLANEWSTSLKLGEDTLRWVESFDDLTFPGIKIKT
jgi:hypothetical protein